MKITLSEILAIENKAKVNERERCIKAVDDEPELPGEMPDEMWNTIRNDRDTIAQAFRIAVKQAKQGIKERILGT